MKLTSLYTRKSIVLDLASTDREGVLRELVESARSGHAIRGLPVDDVVKAILAREKIGSTGLGGGVAIPHVKCEYVKTAVGAFGRSVRGLDFSAVDGEPVHLFFLILASSGKSEEEYMQARRCVAMAVRRENFCKFARNAKSAKDLEELFREADDGR